MHISAEKTNIVVFSACLPGPYAWCCNGGSLAWVQKAQYVGAMLFGDVAGICDSFSRLQRNMLGAWAQLRRQHGKLQRSMSIGLLLRLYKACVPPRLPMGARCGGCAT